jgi:hypothetical protein
MDQIGAFLGPVLLSVILYVRSKAAVPDQVASYQLGFKALLIPAVCALLVLLVARFIFRNPKDLEVKTPKISTKFSRAYWLYLVAAGFFAAGFADFALIGYHFKATNLIPECLIPTFCAVADLAPAEKRGTAFGMFQT